MDLNLLGTFTKVYKHLSYTKAANELNISQAAVSQRIKHLEQNLNTVLFIRKGRSIEATAHANYMMTKLEPAEHLVREALYEIGHKIYVQEQFAFDLVGSNINILASPDSQSQLLDDLRRRKVDLVVDLVTTNDASIISEFLYEEPMLIAVAKGHPRIKADMTVDEYYAEQHVAIKARRQDIDTFTLLADNPKPRNIVFTASTMMTQLTYVANSQALGLTTTRIAKYAAPLGLDFFPCPVKLSKAKFELLYHRVNINNKAHQELRRQVKKVIMDKN
ncbi:LysR family transcriptional regulator [Shewanella sp. 0m-4]